MTANPRNKQGNVTATNARRRRRRNRRQATGRTNSQVDPVHFSQDTSCLAQAITNPFSDAAIGAVIPDQWSPPSIPAMDRLSLDIDPALILAITNPAVIQLEGICVFLVPRSLSAGWIAQTGVDSGILLPIINTIPLNSTFNDGLVDDPILHLYCLFIGFLGTVAGIPNNPRIFCIDTNNNNTWVPGYNTLAFSRFDALDSTASGARICGAGLKMFSDEAPIETGGTVYGGWMSLDDLFKGNLADIPINIEPPKTFAAIERPLSRQGRSRVPVFESMIDTDENSNSNAASNTRRRRTQIRRRLVRAGDTSFSALTIQDSFKYRHTFRGIDGVTVRYSPLQSSVQETFQPIFEESFVASVDTNDPYEFNRQIGVGSHDIIGTSDYVPGVVWRYNTSNPEDHYSIRLECRIHLQVEPDGDCPYMTHTVVPDPHYTDLQLVLENKDAFPVVAKGASFKSFNVGLRDAIKTIGSGMGLAGKAIKLFKSL